MSKQKKLRKAGHLVTWRKPPKPKVSLTMEEAASNNQDYKGMYICQICKHIHVTNHPTA